MGKITLSEALKKATVENNLQNYLGLNADGAIGKMTPERLASVVGGLILSKTEKDLNKYKTPGTYYLNFFTEGWSNAPYTDCFALLEVKSVSGILFQQISSDKGVLARAGEIDKFPAWPTV